MKLYPSTRMRKAFAVVVIGALITSATTVFSQGFRTPEALLDAWASAMTHNCDLECSKRIASMYSQQFLRLNKDALVRTLRYSADRSNDAIILFGKDIGHEELVQMSASDIFAQQLLYKDQSIPDEYRYSHTEILSMEYLSPNEVKVLLRWSGLPAAPKMSEEAIIRLIKEGGAWKIGY